MNNILKKDNNFIHFKVHTEYSIIDSIITIDNLIKKVNELNIKTLVISDFFNFFGLIKFYTKCIKNKIKPIIGIDILINDNKYNIISECTLISLNENGYKNIIKIISISYKFYKSKYNYPVVDLYLLIKYKNDIVVLSGGIFGYLSKCIFNKNFNEINNYLKIYLNNFKDNFYIEISKIGLENEDYYIYNSIKIAKNFSIPLIATNNVILLNKEDYKIHNIKYLINKKNYLFSEINKKYTKNQYFKTNEEMIEVFSYIPESIINTIELSKRCNTYIELNNKHIPKFNNLNNFELSKFFKNTCIDNFKKKMNLDKDLLENKNIYINRLRKEIKIISKMGFQNYFLIVMDFINWAKKNNIPVGPGRGSGAGSLISYILNITEINPIKFDLIFERFLNPERLSMPDLDIDFCVENRDYVINYVINKYGIDNVSKIITFNTLNTKSTIKDVGRILNYPYSFLNKISKLIPNNLKFKLLDIFKIKEINNLYNNDKDIKYLFDISIKLEGIIKNIGKHAGGIVISPNDMKNYIPLCYDINQNYYITQFDKYDIEKVGLIKFDFLGLKTLTTIKNILDNIHKKYNIRIDLNNIKLNDKNSFNILKKTLTNGIFQLESIGIRKIIKKTIPNEFNDIVNIIALFRPGPLQSGMVDNFINRKNNIEKIYYPIKNYEHYSLKKILSNTYGIILYQEQIINIAQKFSNYSTSEADLFRIAISSKNLINMKKQRKKFILGSINKYNIKKEISDNIFKIIEKFSGYGFNKSHSVSYALISYRMLWLKSNFKIEFYVSVINSEINNIEKIDSLIKESKNFNIKINKLNINISEYKFYINNKNEIEYGIGAIKGINKNSINIIIEERGKNGKFKNFLDFSIRINIKKVGKKNMEILINKGLFKIFNINNYDNNLINKYIKIYDYYNIKYSNQINIFD